ncbi:class I SAM-dependent methyltransferase [Hymenobacter sp. BT186]|uniref:Class I SAM-dependent methyltransferase n=1 Tax=Hymenobacter telluris TaxID=2816474 RepID=A0A939F0Q5_9BACT|nr:class I SAM-dependent methyltransferase [Hymenobacter telluris]MBO0359318.1 class I SAM-dependent methyltransferase [Hymenobacter telluris]MBW3375344.1 class I SAM-dependent methyltransferase [Hymenobacter norwichensis]
MKIRLQLFEFEDLPWFPRVIRAGMMDYLRFMISWLGTYQPIVPLLREAMQRTNSLQLLELCAGAGGGTEGILRQLRATGLPNTQITLTDLYPQPAAWQLLAERTPGLAYAATPVDALAVPSALPGFRTVFSAFHHFPPAAAEALLADAVRQRAGIGVFEGAGKHWLEIALAWTVLPVAQLLFTPFMRPFRLSRLFFTYLVPLIPLFTIWDGTVSILRMYPPAQLLALAHRADPTSVFQWQAGKVRHWWGPEVTYLIGTPKNVA